MQNLLKLQKYKTPLVQFFFDLRAEGAFSLNAPSPLILAIFLMFQYLPKSLAQTPSRQSKSNLSFRATDQQVKLLNQKLEYQVIDNSTFQIGNMKISTQNLLLELKDSETLIFKGPIQFMVGGNLVLKDPHGRALWNKTINSLSEITLSSSADSEKNKVASTKTASFVFSDFQKIRDTLKQNLFFNFCIFSESTKNRIQVCTPNYSLVENNGTLTLQKMENTKEENVIIVNGTEVNEHGSIQFDKNIKIVSIAANLASGLSIEAKTELIELELMDIFYDTANSLVQLKLRENSNNESIINYPWEAVIKVDAPFFYIEAFAQVPLKQELNLNLSSLPTEKDRPKLLNEFNKTYDSKLNLEFAKTPSIKLKLKTKGDVLSTGKTNFKWTLKNLNLGVNKPHLVSVDSNKREFICSFEAERGNSWDLSFSLGAGKLNTDQTTLLNLNMQKYYNHLFGLNNSFNQLHWGHQFSYGLRTLGPSGIKLTVLEFDMSYRFHPSFHHSESSTSLRLGYLGASYKIGPQSINPQWFGFKLTHDGPNQQFLKFLGDEHESQIGYFPICLNQLCKSASILNASWQSRYKIAKSYFWSWKFFTEQTTLKTSNSTKLTPLMEVQLGLGLQI